jgi:hypothetical protein
MKKIGMGWQSSVYEKDEHTVVKTKSSRFSQFWRILLTAGPLAIVKGEMRRAHADLEKSLQIAEKTLSHKGFDPSHFGNPIIDTATQSYTQDKVVPLSSAIKNASVEEQKEYYRQYIELVRYLWKFGVHERIFNFALNTGINAQGKIILIDLGELTADKEKALDDIATKRWLRASSYLLIWNKELKKYYRELMEKELTKEVLEKEWNALVL